MTRDPLAVLRARRRALIEALAGRLATDPEADIADTSREIEAVDRVIDHLPGPAWRRLRWPLAVALLCLVAVWLGWTVRTDTLGLRTRVILTAESSTVNFRTKEDWDQPEDVAIEDGNFFVSRASLLEFPGPAVDGGVGLLDVHSGHIVLTDLNVRRGAEVILERIDGNPIDLYLGGSEATGTLSMRGSIVLEWTGPDDERRPLTLAREVPESLRFAISQPRENPGQIHFTPERPFVLSSLTVSHVGFGRERTTALAGEGDFVSTIEKGRVGLVDVGTTYELWTGDHVILAGLDGLIRELSVDDDTITVTLEGTVERLLIGPRGDENEPDRTPNIITYLYTNRPLGFLFGAASFLWAAVWSLWRLIGA